MNKLQRIADAMARKATRIATPISDDDGTCHHTWYCRHRRRDYVSERRRLMAMTVNHADVGPLVYRAQRSVPVTVLVPQNGHGDLTRFVADTTTVTIATTVNRVGEGYKRSHHLPRLPQSWVTRIKVDEQAMRDWEREARSYRNLAHMAITGARLIDTGKENSTTMGEQPTSVITRGSNGHMSERQARYLPTMCDTDDVDSALQDAIKPVSETLAYIDSLLADEMASELSQNAYFPQATPALYAKKGRD